MFSEYCDTKENNDIFSGLTKELDGDTETHEEKEWSENKNNPNKKEEWPENENLEKAKNKANEWYKVLSNAYPGGFEINQNWNESTKILLSESWAGFSIRVSRIQKENNTEKELDSWILNFENIFPNSASQEWDQSSAAQTDKNPTPSFSVAWNNALLSQLFPTPKGQNNWWLDIANQDFCSVVDVLWNNESVIAKKIESVYWYATNYLRNFRDRYSEDTLGNENNNFDKNNKIINFILDDSILNDLVLDDNSSIKDYLFIRKALLSSCILLRSRDNAGQRNEIKQALWIVDNLKKTELNEPGSLTSWEEMIDLLRECHRTTVVYIASNLDTLVEGATSCINWDSNMEEDMKNQILNLLNKQND